MRDSEPSPELTESGDVEETVLDETTLQSTPKAMKERLKQFEAEFFVKTLMKVCIILIQLSSVTTEGHSVMHAHGSTPMYPLSVSFVCLCGFLM